MIKIFKCYSSERFQYSNKEVVYISFLIPMSLASSKCSRVWLQDDICIQENFSVVQSFFVQNITPYSSVVVEMKLTSPIVVPLNQMCVLCTKFCIIMNAFFVMKNILCFRLFKDNKVFMFEHNSFNRNIYKVNKKAQNCLFYEIIKIYLLDGYIGLRGCLYFRAFSLSTDITGTSNCQFAFLNRVHCHMIINCFM